MESKRQPIFPRTPKLTRARRFVVYGIAAGVWLTGALWLLFHYFLMSEGAFGATPHPLEWWWLASHGAFAFASLWLFGLLWGVHIPAGWQSSRRRWSGGTMFGIMLWLVLSGYGLYYLGTNDQVISAVAVLHWSIGLLSSLLFVVHRFARERRRAAASADLGSPLRVRRFSG